MAGQDPESPRRVSRRAVLSTAAAAASLAAAYAALEGLPHLRSSEPPKLAAYDEHAAIDNESVRISHLLRRAGFGASREEFARYKSMGLQATVDELVNYEAIDDSAVEAMVKDPAVQRQGAGPVWLVRMANTKRPLQEKMTLFWHGLLTTEASAVPDLDALQEQNRLFREHATGDFRDLLIGITHDRAMWVYLDIDGSVKASPNENFARELMELFTMGPGNYTEDDVRQAARAFTGWTVHRPNPANLNILGERLFHPDDWDGGDKTFLGHTGNFGPDDIIDIIVDQPATGRYITRRLFEYFAYPEPEDDVLAPFVDAYEGAGRQIGPVLNAIFRSEAFYSRKAYRALAKSPVEYAVGAIKALGAETDTVRILSGRSQALRNMGQVLYDPPNVAGWPSGAVWFSSSAVLARLNYINQLTGGVPLPAQGFFGGPPGAPTPAPTPTATPLPALGTAAYAIDYYLPHALDGNISPESRRVLLDYAGGERALLNADSLRGLVYLILAMPQFQLA
ncbi:MAG TPA: DUF1800 domain-containing protein [Dehalococcoidia bacterium]